MVLRKQSWYFITIEKLKFKENPDRRPVTLSWISNKLTKLLGEKSNRVFQIEGRSSNNCHYLEILEIAFSDF